jgi:hypothetical protein
MVLLPEFIPAQNFNNLQHSFAGINDCEQAIPQGFQHAACRTLGADQATDQYSRIDYRSHHLI